MPSRRFDQDPRAIRHNRVRRKVIGAGDRPRLCVFRSNKHIYVQIIDDAAGHTVVSSSTLDAELKSSVDAGKTSAASQVGASVAKRALAAGIDQVVFDRGGYRYHGRVKALADAAREEGLKF